MVLGKNELAQCIKEGKIAFTPGLDEFQLQPNSIDLRIGASFYIPESWHLTDRGREAFDPDYLVKSMNKEHLKLVKIKPGQFFEILPGESVLVSSLEKVELNSGELMAVLYPRSSMVRRGFIIQGGVVDVMYKGHLVIPVMNASNHNLKLFVGERAYQLLFHKIDSELTSESALKHGVASAKYADATAFNLEARTDSDEEIEYIKKGDIEGLKSKFKVGLN
ncbi:MAG: 2'-deoxycytidine 5'-triphosphate deaminase [Candidatus Doudnabacteria bacterium]|nr:2'-deoxycytidine 5'-triphosphate deaminase [Candidatus Doudnabacteria bacterium]